jgi:hypothetical protein
MAPTSGQHLAYRVKFCSLFRADFQSWFSSLARALHPAGDFQPIRVTSGDGALDGMVISKGLVYQVFAPPRRKELRDGETASKIRADFAQAYSTMGGKLQAWWFVHNHPEAAIGKLTAAAISDLKTANSSIDLKILDIDSLWDLLVSKLSDESFGRLFPNASVSAAPQALDRDRTADASTAAIQSANNELQFAFRYQWPDFEAALKSYYDAIGALGKRGREFHAKIFQRLDRANNSATDIERRERLQKPMDDLLEILSSGELDLEVDLEISYRVFVEAASKHYMIVSVCVTNQSNIAINLLPSWRVEVIPYRFTAYYAPDAEPLQEWENQRRKAPLPASPPLAAPLKLEPLSSSLGYWSFLLRDLEDFSEPIVHERQGRADNYLEVRDLLSGKRTEARLERVALRDLKP